MGSNTTVGALREVDWGDSSESPEEVTAYVSDEPPRFHRLSELDFSTGGYLPASRVTAPAVRRDSRCGARTRRVLPRRRGAGRPRAQATRSSAKSGDSGADEPGQSDPPWLPGHGDVEGVGGPPPDPIPNVSTLVAFGAELDKLRGFKVVLR